LVTLGSHDAWFATGGGATARVFRSQDGGRTWHVVDTPVRAGNQAAGIFSLAFADARHGIAVGGNYSAPDTTQTSVAYTEDGGVTWTAAAPSGATGYLSGVAYRSGTTALVAVGTQGTATSTDGGRTWRRLDTTVANAVLAAPQGDGTMWIAGPHGLFRTIRPN
jgi:photosystem II stability/assembly factor-like uncharacterized protein